MTPIAIGGICVAYLVVLLLMGVNIGIVLMSSGFLGIYLSTGNFNIAVSLLGTTSFTAIKEYVFGVIPLFVMMGLFVSVSGAGKELYDAANVLFRRLRGGLAIATVVSNAVFAAVTGASIASAAVFSKISMPEMIRLKYDKRVASGTVAGSSVLGMLIPPSNLMIIFGSLTGVSIGKLFIAGILPGIILSAMFIVGILILARVRPQDYGVIVDDGAELTADERRRLFGVLLKPWPIAILIVLVLGGMWGGIFTPTEAGGIGAFSALVLLVAKGKFTFKLLWEALKDTGQTCGSILFLLVAAQMFARMLAVTGLINGVGTAILGSGMSMLMILLTFCLIQLIMGCIIDSTSILLLTVPIMYPVMMKLGVDPVWYGIIVIITVEVGLISPPFGISVYTVKSALSNTKFDITIQDIFQGSYMYLVCMLLCLALAIAVPTIVTVLPNLMLTGWGT